MNHSRSALNASLCSLLLILSLALPVAAKQTTVSVPLDLSPILTSEAEARYLEKKQQAMDARSVTPSNRPNSGGSLDQGADDWTTIGASETIDFPDLPDTRTGTTVGYLDDIDFDCGVGTSTSPDVWYKFTNNSLTFTTIDISTCNPGTSYDTKLLVWVFPADPSIDPPTHCNDDYCTDYTSIVRAVTLPAFSSAYICVDGWNGEAGNYELTIGLHNPCTVECPQDAIDEGEGSCFDDYDDVYNSGCADVSQSFQTIACNQTICGTSGNFTIGGTAARDIDWYEFTLANPQRVYFTFSASFQATMALIERGSPDVCTDYTQYASVNTDSCQQVEFEWLLPAGTFWAVVLPSTFYSGVTCGEQYTLTLDCTPCDLTLDPSPDFTHFDILECGGFEPYPGTMLYTFGATNPSPLIQGDLRDAGSFDPEDWYLISLPDDAEVEITATGLPPLDLQLELHDYDGSECTLLQTEDFYSCGTEVLVSDCLPAGTYYVRVSHWVDFGVPFNTNYEISAQVFTGRCAPCEPTTPELVASETEAVSWSGSINQFSGCLFTSEIDRFRQLQLEIPSAGEWNISICGLYEFYEYELRIGTSCCYGEVFDGSVGTLEEICPGICPDGNPGNCSCFYLEPEIYQLTIGAENITSATITVERCIESSCDSPVDVITSLPYTDSGDLNLHSDGIDVLCAALSPTVDAAYSYTPVEDQYVNISVCGSVVTPDIVVFLALGPGDYDFVHCWTAPALINCSSGCFLLFGGNTYCIAIEGGYNQEYLDQVGPYSLEITDCCADFVLEPPNDLIITMNGNDAQLSWSSIGAEVCFESFLVFYSPTSEGPYYYHGDTSSGVTSYTHSNVALHAPGMFYEVYAYGGAPEYLVALPRAADGHPPITKEEVLRRLALSAEND